MQENDNVNTAAYEYITPTVMIRGSLSNPKEAFLVVEKEVLCKIPNLSNVALALLATFYVFNMEYTRGTSNVFIFFEHYFMVITAPKEKTKVGHLISQLAHILYKQKQYHVDCIIMYASCCIRPSKVDC